MEGSYGATFWAFPVGLEKQFECINITGRKKKYTKWRRFPLKYVSALYVAFVVFF